jgi:RNA polymerase sigma-70 factor (ECF subfamily)
VALVDRYHTSLTRLARTFVPSGAVAEEVVQDTWLGVVRGVHGFEGRASLRTWLFRILVNRARTTGARERRSAPAGWGAAGPEPAVDPARFGPDGRWVEPPVPWTETVEDRLDAAGESERVRALIDELPEAQRQVLVLRDVEGLSAAEVCELLDISDANQRVLLHRGRSRVRAALERERQERR